MEFCDVTQLCCSAVLATPHIPESHGRTRHGCGRRPGPFADARSREIMLLACVLVALVSVPPGAPVGGLVSGAGHARQRSTHFVEKTHFSKSNRAVFVAGLEGTGHHAIGPMITAINKAIGSRPLAHVQVLPEAVQAVLYRRGEQPHGAFLLAQDQSVQTLKMIEADRVG